jgi:hypothetical protein
MKKVIWHAIITGVLTAFAAAIAFYLGPQNGTETFNSTLVGGGVWLLGLAHINYLIKYKGW